MKRQILKLMLGGLLITQNTYGQSPDQNYVRTRTPRREIKTETKLNQLTGNKDSIQSTIAYFDGLGRPLQTVQVKGNPDGTKDIVQPVAYDLFGREAYKYLPFAYTGTANGSYRSDAITKQAAFYNPAGTSGTQQSNGVVRTTSPYTLTLFEPSPLNRVTEQGAAGEVWQPLSSSVVNSGHTVKAIYTFNDQAAFSAAATGNAGSRKAALYYVGPTGSLLRGGTAFYASRQLYVTISKDENWQEANGCFGTTEEYKDKSGRVVLKRNYNLKGGTIAEMLSTYYVYDDYGNLRYVLPPIANPDMVTGVPSQAVLSAYCYQYRYDDRNRLIEKKIPGRGWEYLVYNKLDQVVVTQDSLMRIRTPLQRGAFTKYDALGRVVMTGIYDIPNTPVAGQNYRAAIQTTANAQTALWESRLYAGATGTTDYTNAAIPATASSVLQVNYYDNYDNIPDRPTAGAPVSPSSMTNGLLTASRIAVLNNINHFLWSVNYYDDEGRVVTTYKQHYKGGVADPANYDLTALNYNFNDQLTVIQRKHYTNSSVTQKLTISTRNIYDHMGRRVKTWQTIGNAGQTANPRTLLAQLDYNEIGQLKTKKLHSTDSTTFKQTIPYWYNERGWLSQVGDPNTVTATSVYGMKLDYHEGQTNKQYNGNIGGMSWQTKVPTNPAGLYQQKQSYLYTYDYLNRLALAAYSDVTGNNANKFNEEISYDVVGNITALKRKNTTAATYLNDFTYNYTSTSEGAGNRLWSVADVGTANQDGSYTYDGNGNVKSDMRNGITDIGYNILNLPSVLTRSAGNVSYIYDATGAKLRKVVTGGETREYIDGIEYSGTTVDFIANEEGRAVPNGAAAYSYDYYLKDHLGNTRAAIKQDGSILQITDYYAFGLTFNPGNVPPIQFPDNKYKYNGKELQIETGQYDYGARFYDPITGRWNTIDPSAENDHKYSTYIYGFNNPVRFIDPDGRWPDEEDGYPGGVSRTDGGNILATALMETKHSIYNFVLNIVGSKYRATYVRSNDGESFETGFVKVNQTSGERLKNLALDGLSVALVGRGGPSAAMLENAPIKGQLVETARSVISLEQKAAKLSKVERAGEDFTKAGKGVVKDINKVKNGGKMKCSTCGVEVVPAKKHQKGVTPPSNEAHVDHIDKKRNGGSGTPNNGRVRCRGCNITDQ